jgi:hypothetical protein
VLETTESGQSLPPYAVAMMRADPELGRAMDVFLDLDKQRQDLEVSERLIAELGAFVNAAEGGEASQASALAARADVIGARLTLAKIEGDLQLGPKEAHDPIVSRGADLEQRYSALSGATSASELDALYKETGLLLDELHALRPGHEGDLPLARIDAAAASLDDTWHRLGGAATGAASTDPVAFGRIRSQFDQQVADVSAERADYEATIGQAREVALDLTRGGFGRLQSFFADSVLRADMGIVDVFWAEKLEVSDELLRVRGEKDAALADLDRRFQLIDDKMGAPR